MLRMAFSAVSQFGCLLLSRDRRAALVKKYILGTSVACRCVSKIRTGSLANVDLPLQMMSNLSKSNKSCVLITFQLF